MAFTSSKCYPYQKVQIFFLEKKFQFPSQTFAWQNDQDMTDIFTSTSTRIPFKKETFFVSRLRRRNSRPKRWSSLSRRVSLTPRTHTIQFHYFVLTLTPPNTLSHTHAHTIKEMVLLSTLYLYFVSLSLASYPSLHPHLCGRPFSLSIGYISISKSVLSLTIHFPLCLSFFYKLIFFFFLCRPSSAKNILDWPIKLPFGLKPDFFVSSRIALNDCRSNSSILNRNTKCM